MWQDEYERMAMQGEPMPDGLTIPYQLYYQTLSALYGRYRRREVTREQAAAEKNAARHSANVAHERFERAKSSSERYAKMVISVESAANAYAKERTLENADRLYKALYGMEPTKKEEP